MPSSSFSLPGATHEYMVQVVSSPLPNVPTTPPVPSTPDVSNDPPHLRQPFLHLVCPTSSQPLAHGPSNSQSPAHQLSATSLATSSNTASPLSIPRDMHPPLPPRPDLPILNNPTRTHPMTSRSLNNIFKPKVLHQVLTTSPIVPSEPTCVTQALKDPNWRQAMSDEFSALVRQGTWELVPPAPTQHLIGCK
ncbi:hypothetical protein SLE2022_368170 [Rubroshorea leprosula]